VQIALLSTAASRVPGTAAAMAVVRGRFRGREAIATFAVSPLMMPGLVVGVAMLQFFRAVGLRDAWTSLMIAHVIVTLPFVVRTLLAALERFDFTLLDVEHHRDREPGPVLPADVRRLAAVAFEVAFHRVWSSACVDSSPAVAAGGRKIHVALGVRPPGNRSSARACPTAQCMPSKAGSPVRANSAGA